MALTIKQLKDSWIPINVLVEYDNENDARRGIQLPNKAINIYEAIALVGGSGLEDGNKGDVIVSSSGAVWELSSMGATPGQYLSWNGTNWVGVTLTPSIPDGDKGDITVTSSGGVWTIDNNVVTDVKLADMPANTIKGVTTAGDPKNLTVTEVKTLLDYAASQIINTPTGSISSTNVQAAINELATEKANDADVLHKAGAEVVTGVKTFTAQPVGILASSISSTPGGHVSSTNVQAALDEIDSEKQRVLSFQDSGTPTGLPGLITTLNFRNNLDLSLSGSTLNIDSSGGSGGGATDLAQGTRTVDTVQVTSSSGADATLDRATTLLAGVMAAQDKVDLNTSLSNSNALVTLSGVTAGSTSLGTFSGTIIPDNQTVKQALQVLETYLGMGNTVSNGLSGTGALASPLKLGGTLSENTTIEGADNNFNVLNAGTVQLESDSSSRSHRTELVLSGNNTLGAYLRHVNKSNVNQSAQLLIDHDDLMGLSYQVEAGESIGYRISPSTSTAASKLRIDTPRVAEALAVTGQVLTLQSDGSVEYATPAAASPIFEVESDNTIIVYRVVSGSPVVSASRSAGVQTISVTGGVIKIMSVSTEGQLSNLAGDNSFKIVVNNVIGTTRLAYPVIAKWNLSGNPPTDLVPHTQDNDNTPQVQVSAGTAASSITIKLVNMNAFTNWVIKAVW